MKVTRADLLEAVGRCAQREARGFQTEAAALAAAPSQATWKRAMSAWQRVEVLQLGPTASSTTPGGQDFRDQIYSWPLVSRCNVEETLVSGAYANASALLINRRGLAALEYLLFHTSDEVTCASAGWNALSVDEKASRKRAYAQAVATDVQQRADALAAAWSDDFVATLRTAGPGNDTYMTQQGAMNRVSDAIFYVESQVKDAKLARPIGLRECDSPPCLTALESQFASHNTENLRQNLHSFRAVVQGCDDEAYSGIGFDDVLEAQGKGELATRFIAAIDGAQRALDAIDEPDLREALQNDPASVRALYDAVKGVTDILKSEFVTVLDLELPMGLEGDND